MPRDEELLQALSAIHAGKIPKDLESATIDFKEDGKNDEATLKSLLDAALCFANAGGGVVVLGVANKGSGPAAFKGTLVDPELAKKRVYELSSPHLLVDTRAETHFTKRLVVMYVSQSPEIHSDPQGRAPRRIGTDCLPMSSHDQMLLREERQGIDWSAQPTNRQLGEISAIAMATVRRTLSAFTGARRQLARASDKDVLRALGLVSQDGRLLRAGEVLLCDPPAGSEPHITYTYQNTQGGEPVQVQRLRGPLVVAFQRLLELAQARRNLTPVTLPDGQQIQIEDFPELAVREAVANAVIHRDYHVRSAVTIEHSPAVFVVTSPGPLVSGVTPSNILTHPSKPRNPKLAGAARRLGLAEEIGRGVDRMFREMIRSGRELPQIEAYFDRVRVTFAGGAPNTHIARYVAQLPESERDDTDTMLTVIRMCSKVSVTAEEHAPVLQKTAAEAESVLRRLASDAIGMLEPTRESARRKHPSYRLRGAALSELGSAVSYRRRTTDEIDRKVIAHIREYSKITNRTVQNLLDVRMTRAKQILQDLVGREVLVKVSEHERGPGVEYGPGKKFPPKKRSSGVEQLVLPTPRTAAGRTRR